MRRYGFAKVGDRFFHLIHGAMGFGQDFVLDYLPIIVMTAAYKTDLPPLLGPRENRIREHYLAALRGQSNGRLRGSLHS